MTGRCLSAPASVVHGDSVNTRVSVPCFTIFRRGRFCRDENASAANAAAREMSAQRVTEETMYCDSYISPQASDPADLAAAVHGFLHYEPFGFRRSLGSAETRKPLRQAQWGA